MRHFQPAVPQRCAIALIVLATLNACNQNSSPSDATLSWMTPTKNIDGSPIQELAGYYIYYGNDPTLMSHAVQLRDPASTNFVIRNLGPGTHYFRLVAYSASGAQSGLSSPVSKTIP
jgi:Fibronectin type III domain